MKREEENKTVHRKKSRKTRREGKIGSTKGNRKEQEEKKVTN